MDTLRGPFDSEPAGTDTDSGEFGPIDNRGIGDHDSGDAGTGTAIGEEIAGDDGETPPLAIGQDERRMQVRAYNHWASLLGDASFPSIEELEPGELTDFAANSVLLDFSKGIEDPVVQYLGDALARECWDEDEQGAAPKASNVASDGASDGAPQVTIARLSNVPPRSLLSRITDHYMQIIANQAPIGFEAEFISRRGSAILYRGILLPFSSDGETIDFVFGVINWKQMADAAGADELLLEIDQALAGGSEDVGDADDESGRARRGALVTDSVTEWADSPAHETEESYAPARKGEPDTGTVSDTRDDDRDSDAALPDFAQYALEDDEDEYEDYDFDADERGDHAGTGRADDAAYSFASLADYIEAPTKKAVDLDAAQFDPDDYRVEDMRVENEPADMRDGAAASDGTPGPDLADDAAGIEPLPENADLEAHLASARELARTARRSEDRSRQALYAAVGRAYDFSLAAREAPEDYDALIEESGLSVQERAPMTPIVKLVFGADYDKTRLTEYAAVLSHAHRVGIERGALAGYLGEAEGGLKGVVTAERRHRREENGEPAREEGELRAALARKLRELEAIALEALANEGPEFTIAVLRRNGSGTPVVIGEIADDPKLVERAARKLAS